MLLALFRNGAAQEHNMARLVLSDTAFVSVRMGVHGEQGGFKDLFQPESLLRGTLDAASRRTIDKVSVFGRFAYSYETAANSTWRGWIDPYETPFMLADSIPGNLSLERYAMQAGIGLPLGGGWSAGVELSYDVALMAKHRDLRNKNTAMDFRVAPGIHWQGRRMGAGLDLGYQRGTEKVEYSQESSNSEHLLFALYGLWLGQGYGFSSAETSRLKENDRFFSDFQLSWQSGIFSLHNNLRADWTRSFQGETGYNNLQHGLVRTWTWQDDLHLQFGAAHQIDALLYGASMQGFRPLQRLELDPDSHIRVWVNVGDPVFCYYRRVGRQMLRYTYGTSWKLSLAVDHWRMDHSYTEYPQRFGQSVAVVAPNAALTLPLGAWRLSLRAGYRDCYAARCDSTPWQLTDPLDQQRRYWEADAACGGLSVAWTHGRTTLAFDYDFDAAVAAGGVRHAAGLNLVFLF